MAKLKTILFYYNIAFTFILLLTGLVSQNIFSSPVFLIIVFPLIIYFWGYLLINSSAKIKNSLNGQSFWLFVCILLIFNFIATLLIAILNIVFARSVQNFLVAFFYIPFPVYFFLTIYHWYLKLKSVPTSPSPQKITPSEVVNPTTLDHNRRQFLKVVGGTSLSLIALSLFNPKKAGAAFFGSVPGPGTVAVKDALGNKINPAEKQPTDGYKITQVDDVTYPAYYGYVNPAGEWYIMREDASSNFRYSKGTSSFSTNWTGRAALTYDYFDAIF